jgi:hypothetical protein
MKYVIYKSNGHWLADVDCTGDVPVLEPNQQVVSGEHGRDTMLIDGVVSPVSGDALVQYNEKLMDELRSTRHRLLAASDWTQVPDAPVDQAAWAEYRQALRDLPANTDDPRNVVWPEQPV